MAHKNSIFKEEVDNYYENALQIMKKKIDLSVNYDFKFSEENDSYIVELYKKDKLKLRAEYSVVGVYNIPLSVWYWAWNIAFINKSLIINQDNIKVFLNRLEQEYSSFDPVEAEDYYYLLNNPNFYISDENINKIIKLVLYLTKGLWVMPVKSIHNNINLGDKFEYIMITKILQYS